MGRRTRRHSSTRNRDRSRICRARIRNARTQRVARTADIVLSQDGRVLEGTAAQRADLELTGVDAEGRVVYQFKRLEIYVVRVDVSRRPTLPEVRVYGVLAKLPDSSIEVLGKSVARGYFEHQR